MFRQSYLPIRPEDNFCYRTYPANPTGLYNEIQLESIKAQIDLYRWVHGLDWVNFVSIADLHEYFEADYAKRFMGQVVVACTTYDPRRLKGVTKNHPKNVSCYFWRYREDLQYGLEWQICEWLRHVAANDDPTVLDDELNELATCDQSDLKSLYLDPIINGDVELYRTDWVKVYKENNLPVDWTTTRQKQRTGKKILVSRQDI